MVRDSVLVPVMLSVLILAGSATAGDKPVVGWVERVRVYPGDILIPAKLDTGADHSSLHALNLTRIARDGEKWVRFEVVTPSGEKATLERKLVREAKVKRHRGQVQRRPVVRLGICLGKFYKETEVNLVNRRGYEYLMLIGRSFLEGLVAVDPSRKYQVEPDCGEPPGLE